MELIAIVKNKGAKSWQSAYPIKKGVTRAKAQSVLRKQLKKGKTFRIITRKQLNSYIQKLATKTKPTKRRTVRRTKARRVVRRSRRR